MDLLDRDLTVDEEDVRMSLQIALIPRGTIGSSRTTVREIACGAPECFFVAALSLLTAESDAGTRQNLFARLVECPEFLMELTRTDRFSRDQLLEACRDFMKMDKLLDVRLTRLASGNRSSAAVLDAEAVVRVLDVLNEISSGPRLLLVLNQLTHHPDRRIANKAVMLMARRVRNGQWVEKHLDSGDARLRADVVEGLWGVNTAAARKTIWTSLEDENNRVVGNALMGLHMLGERVVGPFVKAMLQDERPPFRWTAAWLMGRMGREEFGECLQRVLSDSEQGVRQAARRALIDIRQAVIARQLEAEALARKQEEEARQALELAALAEAVAAKAARAAAIDDEDLEEEVPTDAEEPAEAILTEDETASERLPPEENIAETVEREAPLEIEIHLDGSYISSGVRTTSARRRFWPF